MKKTRLTDEENAWLASLSQKEQDRLTLLESEIGRCVIRWLSDLSGEEEEKKTPLTYAHMDFSAGVPRAIKRYHRGWDKDLAHIVHAINAHSSPISPSQAAYILATATHESNLGMYMEELASGKAYEMRKDLGNDTPGDGVKYKGRGYVQITGKTNYRRWAEKLSLPLVDDPDIAENKRSVAAKILVQGMMEGSFTGISLVDKVNDELVDYQAARRVVNGTDRAQDIAGLADSYFNAYRDSVKS